MFYEMLGRVVWKSLKSFLRLKYGRTYMPKSVLAGGTVAVGVAVMLAILRASRSES
jgi:hypothetical protein